MIAKATLIGRITKDLELRKTPNQKSIVSFNLACDIGFGENKKTSFIEVVAWNNLAENLVAYQEKGSLISVLGNIQTRSYDAKDGSKRYVTEVIADDIKYLSGKQSVEPRNDFEQANTSQSQNNAQNRSNEIKNVFDDFGIDDSSLPF